MQWLKRFGYLVAILLVFAAGFGVRDCRAQHEQAASIAAMGVIQSDLTVVKNKQMSVQRLLDKEVATNQDLANQLATMKAKPAEIRYVVKSHGVLTPAVTGPEVIEVEPTRPAPPYVFKMNNGLVVARFGSAPSDTGTEYTYQTYELTFDSTIVTTDRVTAVDVYASSSAEPNERYRVVQAVQAIEIPTPEHKLVRAELELGATAALSLKPELLGSIALPWLHPRIDVDVLTPRISGNTKNVMFGIDAVTYNIGHPIPVFENIWLGAGVNVDIHGQFSGAVTLGAKL